MGNQSVDENYIVFADANVEAICAANWGKKGKLTYKQAAKVTSLGTVFRANTTITSFDELQYFTGLTSIGSANNSANGAFNGCTALASVVIPSSVTSIRGYSFYGCTALTTVGSLGNITSIGASAFYNCTHLTTVVSLANLVTVGGNAFWKCSAWNDELNCPNLTGSIPSNAFRGTKLTKVLNLGRITSIGGYGFATCDSMTEIHLPATLTSTSTASVGSSNSPTTAMLTVYSYNTTPPTYGRSCFRAAKVSVVYVPSESVSSYKTKWSELSSKIQAMP